MSAKPCLLLSRITIGGCGSDVCVELKFHNEIYRGSAPYVIEGEKNLMRAASAALIQAVNSLLPTPIITRAVDIQQVSFRSIQKQAVVTLVGVRIAGMERFYPGMALLNSSLLESAAIATLSAVKAPTGLRSL